MTICRWGCPAISERTVWESDVPADHGDNSMKKLDFGKAKVGLFYKTLVYDTLGRLKLKVGLMQMIWNENWG